MIADYSVVTLRLVYFFVIMYTIHRVFYVYRRTDPFFVITLTLFTLTAIVVDTFDALVILDIWDSSNEYVFRLGFLYIYIHTLAHGCFTSQYLQTSLTLPFQFKMNTINTAEEKAKPKGDMDTWNVRLITEELGTSTASNEQMLLESLK